MKMDVTSAKLSRHMVVMSEDGAALKDPMDRKVAQAKVAITSLP